VKLPPGRRLWAGLELLDHQLVDRAGYLAGNVDDLELEIPDGGDLPVVTAVLSGAEALATQIGGATGRWLAAVARRLSADGHGSARIPFALVTDIDSAVHLGADREELASNRAERWARDVLIAKIPGAGHEAE
jgi:hypothetical protein